MSDDHQHEESQLFLLRVWRHPDGHGETLCRGKVQHVLTGKASAFEGWPALVTLLSSMTAHGPHDSDPPAPEKVPPNT